MAERGLSGMVSQPLPVTAARLTAPGRGAVATVRVWGKIPPLAEQSEPAATIRNRLNSLFQAANGLPLTEQQLRRIVFGRWGIDDVEELVICRLDVDQFEIHCHGGEAAVQRVLNDLSNAGCEIVDWRDQVASNSDCIQAECLDVLSRTTTPRTCRIALELANGLLTNAFHRLDLMARSDNQAFLREVDQLLQWSEFGLHLAEPWSVVLTGRPNVGKSSLINALLGYERAIVFDEPGTTRDVVTGETAIDGWPIVLSDTAGIREQADELEAAGIRLARQRLQSADLRVILVDLGDPPTSDDEQLFRAWPDALVVGHKSDRPNCWGDRLPPGSIHVSSLTGAGIRELQQRIVKRLVPTVPQSGIAMPITPRQVDCLKQMRDTTSIDDRQQAIDHLLGR
jgi:tRNA modification GTPase